MIPPMTHPLSKHWKQPSSADFQFDDTHVMMSETAFQDLAEYSRTVPTGTYAGKMWKAYTGDGDWVLRWYTDSGKLDYFDVHQRLIIRL